MWRLPRGINLLQAAGTVVFALLAVLAGITVTGRNGLGSEDVHSSLAGESSESQFVQLYLATVLEWLPQPEFITIPCCAQTGLEIASPSTGNRMAAPF